MKGRGILFVLTAAAIAVCAVADGLSPVARFAQALGGRLAGEAASAPRENEGAPDTRTAEVVAAVLATVAKVKAAQPDAVPMAFWDFDGTILKGDITLGGEWLDTPKLYKGLAERAVEEGFCPAAERDAVWRRFAEGGDDGAGRLGRLLLVPFVSGLFAGQSYSRLLAFGEAECTRVYRKWLFASSLEVLRALEAAGVENHIISASPEVFVKSAAAMLGLPPGRINGTRLELDGDAITSRIVRPIPYGSGKTDVLRGIVAARKGGVPVAAFGNSYAADGDFLSYVAGNAELPGGAVGVAVMINGGSAAPSSAARFMRVCHERLVGD